jgi:squalene-associated FAD-dependent desaturase
MSPTGKEVIVVGGGLAGLGAGCALVNSGFKVTLLERRPYLGGRASSYEHPGTGEVVDNCQHVLLGCCTNLIAFYERLGVADRITWFDELTFLEPGGRASLIRPSWLPAPLHTAPSFLRAASLSLEDKIGIASAMLAMIRTLPADTDENFLTWLKRHGQTERAIDRFWKVVLVSALNEDLDRVSVYYAAQVFRESFLKSKQAGRMGVPKIPLSELYAAAGKYIGDHGGEVVLRSSVDAFRGTGVRPAVCSAGKEIAADYLVLAVPFDVLNRIMPDCAVSPALRAKLRRFQTSPITGIHLWYDKPFTDLPHAVLLDRTIQWMFHKSKLQPHRGETGSYIELVVSSSKSLVERSRGEIIELAQRELEEFFPAAKDAKLLKGTVVKELNATYSALPRSDEYRPPARTAWPQVFLAGDWTATGWPATMEGAVRSGYAAAEAILEAAGEKKSVCVPDLRATGLMRLFG